MAKDPAFLFYSNDFYTGTRLMLPEERACYIDLLVYQHQNGIIPLDLKRVRMFCTGIDEATLKATLEAKFKWTADGWVNERLQGVIDERKSYAIKQSENGKIGQVMKQAKALTNAKEFKIFKDYFYSVLGKKKALIMLEENKATIEGLLKASLKHLEDEDEIEDEIENKDLSDNLIFPFDSENFKKQWQVWRDYKKEQFKFIYKPIGEQAALKEIGRLSKNNEQTAIAIIHQSINNGWKGFFELKNNNNGTKQGLSSSEIAMDYAKRKAAERNAKRNAKSYE